MKRRPSLLRDITETLLLALLMYLVIDIFSARVRIDGFSMEPTLDDGMYVFADKVSFIGRPPERGELVVFSSVTMSQDSYLIDRIIGIPDDTVEISKGVVMVNGKELEERYIVINPSYEYSTTLMADEYFILGDNRNNSHDSHIYGPVPRKNLIGRPILVYWPPNRWGRVDKQKPNMIQLQPSNKTSMNCTANCSWANEAAIGANQIQEIFLSPMFANDNTIFARSSLSLFISTNRGEHWSPILPNAKISSIAFSPDYETDKTIVLGSVSDGIFISNDGGKQWVQRKLDTESPNLISAAISSQTQGRLVIYAATSTSIFQSVDLGLNWSVFVNQNDLPTDEATNFSSFFVAGQDIFIVTNNDVFRLSTAENTWEALKEDKLVSPSLYISPTFELDHTIIAVVKNLVYKTIDQGRSWIKISKGLPSSYWVDYTNKRSQLAFSPRYNQDGRLYLATYAGLYTSDNFGKSWKQTSKVEALSIAVSPAAYSDGTLVLGGRNGIQISPDYGTSWEAANFGITSIPIYSIVASTDSSNDGLVFAGGQGIWRSIDRGNTWMSSGLGDTIINDLAISPDFRNDSMVFAATNAGLNVSTDRGTTWQSTNMGIGDIRVLSIAVSPVFKDDRTAFAGTYKRGLFRSSNAGKNWKQLRGDLPNNVTIYAISISPAYSADKTLFLATSLGVYRSTDGGGTWEGMLVNSKNQNFMAVEVSPEFADDHVVYASGDGILRSEDAGQTWSHLDMGTCCYTVTSLLIRNNPQESILYAGTYGGGAFRSKDGGITWEKLVFSNISNVEVTSFTIFGTDAEPWISTNNWGLWLPVSRE